MRTASKRWGDTAMKKCPHCKADIEENARFCLYCMTPLDDKQEIKPPNSNHTRWLVFLAAFLVLAAGIIFFLISRDAPTGTTGESSGNRESIAEDTSSDTSFSSSADESGTAGENPPENTTCLGGSHPPAGSYPNQTNPTSRDTQANESTGLGETSRHTSTTTSRPSRDTSSQSLTNSNTTSTTKSSSTTPSPTVTYLYRQAKKGDDFSLSYPISENDIVITGVSTASKNGEYVIPEQIDGKTVIAIMGLAFCDDSISDTVKKVVVPASVKTIWNNAFATCFNLTDIYFCGDAIYTEAQAFAKESKRNGTLTIHCSANCNDRNFRYYKNSAAGYDAVYEEWNG